MLCDASSLILQLATNATPPEMSFRCDPIAVRAIVKAVADNSSLLTLDVTRANLRDDVGVEIARSLETNSSLTRLDMDENRFGPSTLAALGGTCDLH